MFRADRLILCVLLGLTTVIRAASPVVFCWNPTTNQPGISPMARISCEGTPASAISTISMTFARLPAPQRSVLLGALLCDPLVFAPANLKSVVENGPDCSVDTRYLQLLFTQMKSHNLVPARFILDLEGDLCTWALTPSNGTLSSVLMPIFNDSASFSKLPAIIQQYSPADFDNIETARGFAATNAWNAWQASVGTQALRQTVMTTASKIFGVNIPVTNWGDILPSFMVYDINSWPEPSAAVSGESSPALYLSAGGNRYAPLQKDARWNHFLDTLNQVRSAIRNGPVVPWIAAPSYASDTQANIGSPWLWREQIKHLNEMGITEYLYFNPMGQLSDDQYASKVFTSMQTPSTKPEANYAPLQLDADSVTTGSVTTKYTDFLANLTGPIMK